MPRHFGPQNAKNGYAAMGSAMQRPRYSGLSGRDLRTAIEAERRRAARQVKINAGKKK